MKKERAFARLARMGLAQNEEYAKRLIMARQVFIDKGRGTLVPVEKPGQMLAPDTPLVLRGVDRFVSRGAYKLLTALETFHLDVNGFVCLDAGASTGGFTDCLLQHGAAKVYAADVGRGQLHEKLRQDPRVIRLEGVNLRLAGPDLVPEQVDMITADVSFISLTRILPPCMTFLKPNGLVVALIKPQFEVPPHCTDKGVVRDEALRRETVRRILDFCREELNLVNLGVEPSRILGPKGNQEYLAAFKNSQPPSRSLKPA